MAHKGHASFLIASLMLTCNTVTCAWPEISVTHTQMIQPTRPKTCHYYYFYANRFKIRVTSWIKHETQIVHLQYVSPKTRSIKSIENLGFWICHLPIFKYIHGDNTGVRDFYLWIATNNFSIITYIEDVTCPRVDMNFIFEWSTRYLTSERSERVRYPVEHEKIKFISISEYVIFCLLYKHQWNTKSACFQRRDLLCNHNDGDLFTCEDNMLSSRVKIWSFRGKAHLVFHWCLNNKTCSRKCIKVPILDLPWLTESVTFMDHEGSLKSSGKLSVGYKWCLQWALKSSIRESFYFDHLQHPRDLETAVTTQHWNLHWFNLAAVSLAQELAISQEEKRHFITWFPIIELFMHHLLIFN